MKINFKNLSEKQKEFINLVLNSESKFYCLNAGRQSGKTYSVTRLAVILGLSVERETVLIFANDYDQVKIIFDNIMALNDIEYIIKNVKNSKPYEILLHNGTILKFKSGDRTEGVRGPSPKYIIYDEFAFSKPGIMRKIRPSTSAKKGSKIILTSSPNGKDNEFYQYCKLGMDGKPNYKYFKLTYLDNPNYDEAERLDAQLTMPEWQFDQEYNGSFDRDAGLVFVNVKNNAILLNFQPPEMGEKYYAGIDWGKQKDFTVLTILNKDHEVVYTMKTQKNWPEQVKDIATILHQYKPYATYAETNSMGDVLISDLKKLYLNVKPFWTSAESKRNIIEDLRLAFAKNEIKIPDETVYPDMLYELLSYESKKTSAGTVIYNGGNGKHDDHVMSLAIANFAYKTHNTETKLYVPNLSQFYK